MTATQFFEMVATKVKLKPGTCRAYANLMGFKPAQVIRDVSPNVFVYEREQLQAAVDVITAFRNRKAGAN